MLYDFDYLGTVSVWGTPESKHITSTDASNVTNTSVRSHQASSQADCVLSF